MADYRTEIAKAEFCSGIKKSARPPDTQKERRPAKCIWVFAATMVLTALLGQPKAQAQFVCDSVVPGGADGATATGTDSFACGTRATADGVDTTAVGTDAVAFGRSTTAVGRFAGEGASVDSQNNTAFGYQALRNVDGQSNTAVGSSIVSIDGDRNTSLGSQAGNDLEGDENTALGFQSGFRSEGDRNTAAGYQSGVYVLGDSNVAYGSGAGSEIDGDNNIAIGTSAGSGEFNDPLTMSDTISIGNNALASANGAIALGKDARASGPNAIAFGNGASATGSIAMGTGASAANGGAAFGDFSSATGTNSTAIGPNTTVAHKNAAAFGNGATTTRNDQQVFGTSSNTYTMRGVTSSKSKSAQGKPTHIVTSNSAGDLAAHTPRQLGLATKSDVRALQSDINRLGSRDNELTEGLAAVASLAQPIILPGQTFAMRAGWGGYDDGNAVGFTAAGVIARDVLRPGSGTLVVDGGVGVGTNQGEVAGRAGLNFGW